jgi:hypothetical protein
VSLDACPTRSPGRPLAVVLGDWPTWGGAASVAVFGGSAVRFLRHPWIYARRTGLKDYKSVETFALRR